MFLNKLGSSILHIQEKTHQAHFPDGHFSIEAGLDMLNFLHTEISDLFHGTKDTSELMLESPNTFFHLKNKFMALSSAYIMHVCTIEGIIRKSFQDMKQELEDCGYKSVMPNDSSEIKKLEKDLESYKWYRDKVFAHLSFSWPKDDSKSLQQSTLMYYVGNFFIFKKTHLVLGGGSVTIDKKEITPTVDIIEEHKSNLQHFLDWEMLFTNILSKIKNKEKLRKELEDLRKNK